MRLASLIGPDLKQILKEDPDQVRELFDEIHAEDLADLVADLEPDEAAKLLERLPAENAADIFERLDDQEQEELVATMPPESVAHIASEMETDERADFFSILPDAVGEQLLETLEKVDPVAAEEVREIEKYPETSAGHLMTTSYVTLSPKMTVATALAAVRARAKERDEFVYNAYVLDGETLVGVVSVRDLIVHEPGDRLDDIMRTNIISVTPTLDQEDTARKMAKYDLNAMPVVDENGQLLGVITVDDVIDVLVAEQTEDVQRLGAVEPLDVPYFQTSFMTFIKKRAGWLIALFLGEFLTTSALRFYDHVFEVIHGALFYIPLLISAGGNSGSQSSTLVIRGLAVGELKPKDWLRIFVREALMGVVLGSILGVIGFGRVLMYGDQTLRFAFTVAFTLIGICVSGCTVGSMIPLVLKRIGVDPATSSTPFIASLVDVLGIIVFVQIAKIVMASVLHAGGIR
jgi:magnesium transporter